MSGKRPDRNKPPTPLPDEGNASQTFVIGGQTIRLRPHERSKEWFVVDCANPNPHYEEYLAKLVVHAFGGGTDEKAQFDAKILYGNFNDPVDTVGLRLPDPEDRLLAVSTLRELEGNFPDEARLRVAVERQRRIEGVSAGQDTNNYQDGKVQPQVDAAMRVFERYLADSHQIDLSDDARSEERMKLQADLRNELRKLAFPTPGGLRGLGL